MKGNHFVEKDSTGTKTKFDSLIFGKSKRQLYHEQLSLYNIILQNSHGVSAVELAVIPIQLSYDQLSPLIKSIKILDKVFYTPLSSVGPYSVNGLATPKVVSTTKENIPVENKTNNVENTVESSDIVNKRNAANELIKNRENTEWLDSKRA